MLMEQVALIVRLGEKRASEFLLHLEMTRGSNLNEGDDTDPGVDFPEFLFIMRWILDSNFGNFWVANNEWRKPKNFVPEFSYVRAGPEKIVSGVVLLGRTRQTFDNIQESNSSFETS